MGKQKVPEPENVGDIYLVRDYRARGVSSYGAAHPDPELGGWLIRMQDDNTFDWGYSYGGWYIDGAGEQTLVRRNEWPEAPSTLLVQPEQEERARRIISSQLRPKRQRGTCLRCDRRFRLLENGMVEQHNVTPNCGGRSCSSCKCVGGGRLPKEAKS